MPQADEVRDRALAYVLDASALLAFLQLRAGLSLGDRACLALAGLLGTPALTTDRLWAKLALGEPFRVDVELLR